MKNKIKNIYGKSILNAYKDFKIYLKNIYMSKADKASKKED